MLVIDEESLEKQKQSTRIEMLEMSNKAYERLSKEAIEPIFKETPLKAKIKKREYKMTEEEKEMNRKILKGMSTKLNFVKNPRFRSNNKCLLYSNDLFKDILSKENPFVVEPIVVTFREYQMNSIYQIDLKLLNRTSLLTNFKYIPPTSENFSIKRVVYPKKDSSLIAPGMSAKVEILFNATSLDSFQDEMTIISENFAFKVPLKAIRDSPALSLDNPMDCKKCLIGDQVSMVFRCKNNGGDAHFKFLQQEIFENETLSGNNSPTQYSSGQNQNDNEVLEIGPFSIFPSEFYLYKGMMIEIFVNFSPKKEGNIEKKFIICCDSKTNIEYKIKGEGILIDMGLISLDGLKIDESAEKLESLFFEDTFPFTSSNRQLRIVNKSSVSVKFHWDLYDIYSKSKFSIDEDHKDFQIEPEEGVFGPNQELQFSITFNPKNSKIYEKKLDLIVEDTPFQAIKSYNPTNALSTIRQRNLFTKGEPFVLAGNSPYPSYPIFSFNLKGKGKLPFLEVDNNFIDFGDIYVNQLVSRTFSIINPKTGTINFKLSKILQNIKHQGNFYKKINNFFCEDKNFPFDSIFHAKKAEVSFSKFMPIGQNTEKNFFKQGLTNTLNSKNISSFITIDDEKDSYEKVKFLKLYTSSEFIAKKLKTTVSNKSVHKRTTKNYYRKLTTKESVKPKSEFDTSIVQKSNSNFNTNNYMTSNNTERSITLGSGMKKNLDAQVEEDLGILIKKDQRVDFSVVFQPKTLGIFKGSMIFTPEDGVPFSIDIKANVKGPKIKLDIPSLDFGLFPISELKTIKFKIINISPIPATYLIKQSRFKNINFSNFKEKMYQEDHEGQIKEAEYRQKIESIYDYENRDMIKNDYKNLDLYKLKFTSIYGVVDANSSFEITASFLCPYPKLLEDTLEIMIESSESYFINIHADCQEALAYLDTTIIQPSNIYVSVPIKFKDNIINLINPSNLPIKFRWEEVFKNEEIKVSFSPNVGIIPAKSKKEIRFSATYFSIKEVDDLFKCFIDELEVPLGVIIKGQVTGLDIEYELNDDNLGRLMSSKMTESYSVSSLASNRSKKMLLVGQSAETTDRTLKSIDLRNIKVNKPYNFSFKIKNLSGIVTNFNIYCKNFQPGAKGESDLVSALNVTSKSTKSKQSFSKTNHSYFTGGKSIFKKDNQLPMNHMMLSDAHEDINFTSPKGYEFTRMRQVEKDSVLYLSNKKGIAIIIQPNMGRLEPHSDAIINLTIYNECVGDFEDELVCEIKGLPPKTFPINMKIRGNPLQLSPFQPGFNYEADPPTLHLGQVLTKVNRIEKTFKLLNTGSNIISVDWKVFDYNDILYPKRDIFQVKISENKKHKFSLVYQPIDPEEFPEDKKCYEIFPKSCIINQKSTRDFLLTFKADNPGNNSALIVGYPKFIEGDSASVKLSELAIKVDANGVIPNLVVDKKKTLDDIFLYKFYYHSSGISPNPKRSIILINKEKINLIVKVDVDGPFKILKTEPVEATLGPMIFNIIPNSNLKLDVKFMAPNPQNEIDWPMTLVNEKYGKLKVTFENQEFSEYHLTAVMRRPRLKLHTTGNESIEGANFVDFGKVNCETYKRFSLFITNETEVEAKWSINYVKFIPKMHYGHGTVTKDEKEDFEKTDDPDVFIFNITQGNIPGPSLPLINLPIGPGLPEVRVERNNRLSPVKVEVMFKPKKNVLYKSRYRIITETGNQIDFILKGHGSYFEEHI